MRKVLHIPLSPFCRKLRLVLAEKALVFELIKVVPWEEPELVSVNPAGTVPVLVEPDGSVIAGSGVAAEYLEELFPVPALIPGSPLARAEVRRLAAWFDETFHRDVTLNILAERLTKRMKREGEPDARRIREGRTHLAAHLDHIGALARERRWLAGDDFSIADLAAAAHLSCLDFIGDIPWADFLPAKEWYARVKSRPSFRPLLADQLPGWRPPPHYADLDF